jgi:hypothetical protein
MFCLFLVVHIEGDVVVSELELDMEVMDQEKTKSYVLLDEFVYGCEDILVAFYVFERIRSVFFNPTVYEQCSSNEPIDIHTMAVSPLLLQASWQRFSCLLCCQN